MLSAFKRKEEEEKMRSEGRLPPGQSLTQRFPVLHYGPVPSVDLDKWDFKVWGLVDNPFRLTWEEFNQLPKNRIVMDLHCVTKWSLFDSVWEGVTLRTLMNVGLLQVKPQAVHVMQHAEYGYTTNLPLEIMLQENFLLATHHNDQPITPDHGYPLRGVIGAVPGRSDLVVPYLWKGAKWMRGLEFMPADKKGFWEEAGYHNEGDVWKEQRTER
ncbi:MAG: sulfite oxidase-like oxidoreductase [Chloroflexi bacterium HGW-Chloroflexi-10]|nr:MAG: sulfite oxidase-like oxidoreductase [Chloroflexi bacterium HGW-Chloroflexi-10]